MTMRIKIATAIALLLTATSAALAQSAYTTGTANSDEAAGLPFSGGYGSGLYAYVPDYGSGYTADAYRRRGWSRAVRLHAARR